MSRLKRIQRRKQSRINVYKQLEMGTIAKSIQALRKALVNANNEAMTTVDELDAMMLEEELSGNGGSMAVTYNQQEIKNLEAAIQACEGVSQKLQEAVALSDQAKKALRGELPQQKTRRSIRSRRNRNRSRRTFGRIRRRR